jgi:hypothetical protein
LPLRTASGSWPARLSRYGGIGRSDGHGAWCKGSAGPSGGGFVKPVGDAEREGRQRVGLVGLKQMHGDDELGDVERSALLDISKVPDLSKNLAGQVGLFERDSGDFSYVALAEEGMQDELTLQQSVLVTSMVEQAGIVGRLFRG